MSDSTENFDNTMTFLSNVVAFMQEKAAQENEGAEPAFVFNAMAQSCAMVAEFIFGNSAPEEVIVQTFALESFFAVLKEDPDSIHKDPNLFLQTVANRVIDAVEMQLAEMRSLKESGFLSCQNEVGNLH